MFEAKLEEVHQSPVNLAELKQQAQQIFEQPQALEINAAIDQIQALAKDGSVPQQVIRDLSQEIQNLLNKGTEVQPSLQQLMDKTKELQRYDDLTSSRMPPDKSWDLVRESFADHVADTFGSNNPLLTQALKESGLLRSTYTEEPSYRLLDETELLEIVDQVQNTQALDADEIRLLIQNLPQELRVAVARKFEQRAYNVAELKQRLATANQQVVEVLAAVTHTLNELPDAKEVELLASQAGDLYESLRQFRDYYIQDNELKQARSIATETDNQDELDRLRNLEQLLNDVSQFNQTRSMWYLSQSLFNIVNISADLGHSSQPLADVIYRFNLGVLAEELIAYEANEKKSIEPMLEIFRKLGPEEFAAIDAWLNLQDLAGLKNLLETEAIPPGIYEAKSEKLKELQSLLVGLAALIPLINSYTQNQEVALNSYVQKLNAVFSVDSPVVEELATQAANLSIRKIVQEKADELDNELEQMRLERQQAVEQSKVGVLAALSSIKSKIEAATKVRADLQRLGIAGETPVATDTGEVLAAKPPLLEAGKQVEVNPEEVTQVLDALTELLDTAEDESYENLAVISSKIAETRDLFPETYFYPSPLFNSDQDKKLFLRFKLLERMANGLEDKKVTAGKSTLAEVDAEQAQIQRARLEAQVERKTQVIRERAKVLVKLIAELREVRETAEQAQSSTIEIQAELDEAQQELAALRETEKGLTEQLADSQAEVEKLKKAAQLAAENQLQLENSLTRVKTSRGSIETAKVTLEKEQAQKEALRREITTDTVDQFFHFGPNQEIVFHSAQDKEKQGRIAFYRKNTILGRMPQQNGQEEQFIIGREAPIVISPDNIKISRQHAVILVERVQGFLHIKVRDKGSKNGTYINGRELLGDRATEIFEGDVVSFSQDREGEYVRRGDYLIPKSLDRGLIDAVRSQDPQQSLREARIREVVQSEDYKRKQQLAEIDAVVGNAGFLNANTAINKVKQILAS